MSRTLEQKRAHYALTVIEGHRALANKDKLATLIQKAPIQVLQNGLGQMLAYLLADDKNKHTEPSWLLYEMIQTWLCGTVDQQHPCRVYHSDQDLINQLVSGNRADYQRAQQETLALFNWLKKFAQAWLNEEKQASQTGK